MFASDSGERERRLRAGGSGMEFCHVPSVKLGVGATRQGLVFDICDLENDP